ncbi:MAG TPA: phosphoribosyltransferase family protein [Ferruginibacter sp.]|nr:phosphoribosyltransferase family protein [Ferruginibacter sp.]HMP21488.1 phosphoribosyltransferase family protein [Ferruginibacter sp.]
MAAPKEKNILSKATAAKKLQRIALQITEQNYNEPELVLIGIKGSGIVVAGKIAAYIKSFYNGNIILATLSVDKKQPADIDISPAVDCSNKAVILIDDVANSGRTMLYSLKPLLQTYPKKIQTAALVERTYKSFPIALDYVGHSVSTTRDEHIYVEVTGDEVEGVWISEIKAV